MILDSSALLKPSPDKWAQFSHEQLAEMVARRRGWMVEVCRKASREALINTLEAR